MNSRVEAARLRAAQKAHMEASSGPMRSALAAADAVTFDAAAIERVAKEQAAQDGFTADQYDAAKFAWGPYKKSARAVIAALKGDDQ